VTSVAVSIVTFNSARVIADCLHSIPSDVPVYIVDNGSSDNTLHIVTQTRPTAIIIKPHKNLGFGRAHNIVFRRTQTDFVLVLNPDTILQSGCFAQLMDAAQTYPEAGIIGALHVQDDGRVNACFRNDLDYAPHLARARSHYRAKAAGSTCPTGDICVEQITGALMLIRRAALRSVKGFNRHLFMYFEDDDLCARVRLAGYSVVLCPAARVVHLEGQSTQAETAQDVRRSFRVDCIKGYHFERSRKIVQASYQGWRLQSYSLVVTHLWKNLRRAVRYRFKNDIGRTIYYLAGMAGLLSPLPRRLKTARRVVGAMPTR
jgi:N-acetylglucosaminyl-diphospho-decaprenol L-rhamnosyltransferase